MKAYFVNDPLRRAMLLNVGYPVMGVVLMLYKGYSMASEESYLQEYLLSSIISTLFLVINLYGISVCQTIFLMYFKKLIRIQYYVSTILRFSQICMAYTLSSSAIYMMILSGMNPFLAYAIPLTGTVVIIFCAEVIKNGVGKWLRS